MLESTIKHLKETTLTIPIPKSRDSRSGYWNVQCIVVDVNDTEIWFRYTCEDWLDHTFRLPIPHRLDNLFESIFLSISEMIVQQRIEFLCSVG